METNVNALPASKYFHLEAVADGVYAAFPTPAGGAAANAGFVDLGDRVLVVDTFRHTFAARDLRAAAEQLTAHPIAYVVNTHYHGERVLGNSVFADVPIIATAQTRDLIAQESGAFIAFAQVEANRTAILQEREQELAAEDETWRRWRADRLTGDRELAAAAPTMRLTLPNMTFDPLLVLHGTRRTAQLLTFGGGHTASDSFVYLPEERIAFMSDLVFVRHHPALEDGDPEEWVRILERVEETLDITTVIGGHGPVGTGADIPLMRRYLTEMLGLVRGVVRRGGTVDEAIALPVPPAYATWGGPPTIWERMTRTLYGWVTAHGQPIA
jgi:cyclase